MPETSTVTQLHPPPAPIPDSDIVAALPPQIVAAAGAVARRRDAHDGWSARIIDLAIVEVCSPTGVTTLVAVYGTHWVICGDGQRRDFATPDEAIDAIIRPTIGGVS